MEKMRFFVWFLAINETTLPAAAPRYVHILALLGPLDPHPDPVLEEGGDETEPRQVRQHMFRTPSHLEMKET